MMQAATVHVDNVNREIDKVNKKLGEYRTKAMEKIDELMERLVDLQEKMKTVDENSDPYEFFKEEILALIREIKTRLASVSSGHKDIHSSISKVGKCIEKNFTSDYECVSTENFLKNGNQQLLDEILCHHYNREGLHNVAAQLAEEANLNLPVDPSSPYAELIRIVGALRQKDLEPALDWVSRHREKLEENKSMLEFKLHKMKYLTIIDERRDIMEAILYARQNLSPFYKKYESCVPMLMGCLMFAQTGLGSSPFAHLLAPSSWESLCNVFIKDTCSILGISVDSPLSVCLEVGCNSLPVLVSIREAMHSQSKIWKSQDELPIELGVKPKCRYHSIFACPILKQQTTIDNPPMKLVCGHVISKDALSKLASSSSTRRLKCPYCPVEQSSDDATYIYF